MAKLQTHSNFESIVNPNDKNLSEKFNAERVDDISELAKARIEATYSNGGFEGVFEGREKHSVLDPYSLARQVKSRVESVTKSITKDVKRAENGSSASILDTNLIKFRGQQTADRIFKVNRNTKISLTALSVVKESTSKAEAEVSNQVQSFKTEQAKILSERSWWRKAANKFAKVVTLGGYALIEKKKRQKYFNAKLEKALKKRFDKIKKEIAQAEKEATTSKERMKKHIQRVLSSTKNTDDKSKLINQAIAAMTHNGTLGSLSLNNWKSFNGGRITSGKSQEKIDFLEAAKEVPEFTSILYAKNESAGKSLKQEEMINSAKKQQNLIMDLNEYKFDDLRTHADFKDIEPAEKVPETTSLINDIENQLKGNGVDIETDIYGISPEIKGSDLMTDSARLVLLIKAIAENKPSGITDKLKKSVKIRREINAWIDSMDNQTGGGIETHDPTDVKDELNILKKSPDGLLEKTAKFLTTAQNIETLTKKEVEDLRKDIISFAGTTQTAYEKFLNRKDTKNFPDKDFNLIKAIWDKVQDSRGFLLTNSGEWMKEFKKRKLELAKNDSKTNDHLKLLNAEIKYLNGKKEGSIKFLEAAALAAIGGGAKAKQITAINQQLQDKIARLDTVIEKKKSILDSISLPEFSNLKSIQSHLDKMSTEQGIDYTKKISKEVKSSSAISLNERIQNEFSTKLFKNQMDKKFVQNLAKNDQYETLKTVSEGTTVKLTYKEVGGAKSLDFPNDLNTTNVDKEFIVLRKDDKVIHLRNNIDSKVISISNPAANKEGTTAYKNAVVRKTATNDPEHFIGGAGEHAIVYNMKIAA